MRHRLFFVTGVSGSGKTTIGRLLAARSGLPFFDGDDFHPPANIQKMAAGHPLDDEARRPWLAAIRAAALAQLPGGGGIFACSALKKSYRKQLEAGLEGEICWVFLQGDFDTIQQRLSQRRGHFMPVSLLQSQFDSLEPPSDAFVADVRQSPEAIVNMILQHENPSEFGLAGLGVMGKSLSRNLARNGVRLSLYNRRLSGEEEQVAVRFIAQHSELQRAAGFEETAPFVSSLERPRRILLMVPAGAATDALIGALLPHLSPGDLLIDGGNAFFEDSRRRAELLDAKGILFLGAGISGGEAGALSGPSIMAGGASRAFELALPYLGAIAARDREGHPCCALVGSEGAGHFVKMVHNGIEYAEMQLLAESYWVLKQLNRLSNTEIAAIFASWQRGELASYLLEITVKILQKSSGEGYLLDQIVDKAGSKGTGAWSTAFAATAGAPASLMAEALFARYVSEAKATRERLQAELPPPAGGAAVNLRGLRQAYAAARWLNHLQGFELMALAARQYAWQSDFAEVARIWTNGCIIRSRLMEQLSVVLRGGPASLLLPEALELFRRCGPSLRRLTASGIRAGLALPCYAAAANLLNGMGSAFSPANLLSAQRDFFGAHGYERIGDSPGKLQHTQWE